MRALVVAAILLAGCAQEPEGLVEPVPVGPQLLDTVAPSARGETAVAFGPDGETMVAYIGELGETLAWAGPAEGPLVRVAGPDGPGDVDLASGARGIHAVGLVGRAGRVPSQVWAQQAWSDPIDVSAGSTFADRPFLDAYGDTLLVTWNGQGDGLMSALSRDGGATWQAPRQVATFLTGTHGGAAVGPQGELAVVYASDPRGVFVSTSADGATWTERHVAAGSSWAWPAVDIDARGAMHAVWTTAYGDDLPASVRGYGGELQPAPRVLYARSDDRGASWSTPRALTGEGHAGFYPWMDARGERVVVAWYDVEIGAMDDRARVQLAFLEGEEVRFATPTKEPVPLGLSCESALRCRERGPVGESNDVALRADGRAAVAWLQEGEGTEVWYANVLPD